MDRLRLRVKLPDAEVAERRAKILELVASLELVDVDSVVLDRAAQPMPTELGTLDAVHLATVKLRERVLEVAAEVLGTGRGRLTLQGGRILDLANPASSVTFCDLARAATPGSGVTITPGLEASAYYVPPTVTFASGTHIAIVEVDPSLASVIVRQYVVVDDCGTMLNPMMNMIEFIITRRSSCPSCVLSSSTPTPETRDT